MSTRHHTTDRTATEAGGRLSGIASFEVEDGGLVVYDRDDHRAWIRVGADETVSLTEVR